jgi:hypothetical protein
VAPLLPPPGLVRDGDGWLYEELAVVGHVTQIGADGSVTRAQPFAPLPPAPAASSAPAGAPADGTGGQ